MLRVRSSLHSFFLVLCLSQPVSCYAKKSTSPSVGLCQNKATGTLEIEDFLVSVEVASFDEVFVVFVK